VKIRVASCLLGLGRVDEALSGFGRILAFAEGVSDPEQRVQVKAAALAGRGECYWKKKEYEKGMWDFLRVVVLFDASGPMVPKALWHASACMKNLAARHREAGEKEQAGIWRGRSRALLHELGEKFPASPWLHKR
jgi:hypothetical protein